MAVDGPLAGATAVLERWPYWRGQVLEICLEEDGQAYAARHLPGAGWAHWRTLLWSEYTRAPRRAAEIQAALRAGGFDPDRPLLLYAEQVQFAAYAVWVLAGLGGVGHVHYLDGGKLAWGAAGGELATGVREPIPTPIDASRPGGSGYAGNPHVVGRDQVLADLETALPILDLRSPAEFSGELATPLPGRPGEVTRLGRIRGALSLPFKRLLDEHDRILPDPVLRKTCAELTGLHEPGRCVVYCRSGHRSALGWLALHHYLGWPEVAVYDGAWLEWANLVGAPIDSG
jgi:thiosulfate/3-mercaptopyruvate sulfurtransferase